MSGINIAPTATIDDLREKIGDKFELGVKPTAVVVTLRPNTPPAKPLAASMPLQVLLKDDADKLDRDTWDKNPILYVTVAQVTRGVSSGGVLTTLGHVPTILMVRRWAGPDCSVSSIMARSLADLQTSLEEMGWGKPKLYYFKDGVFKSVNDRMPISDANSFDKYLECKVPRPPVLAFYENSADSYPVILPHQEQEAEEKSQASARTPQSSRSGQEWSDVVKQIDGNQCVVCKSKIAETLGGAHHIGVDVDLTDFELQNHYECANGYCMCANCHKLYDSFSFWIDGTKILVEDALQQNEPEWKARHETDIVLMPKRKGRNLMTAEMREFRKDLFEKARKKRLQCRDDPTACRKCEDKCKKPPQIVTPHKKKMKK